MVSSDDLMSYYKLDENAANTTVTDAHGTEDGTASTNTSNLYDASGKINSRFDFVTANSELVTGAVDMAGSPTNFTISFWLYADAVSGTKYPLSHGYNGSSGNGQGGFRIMNDKIAWFQAGKTVIEWGTSISADTWYHVVGIKSGSNAELFVDADSKGTASDWSFAASGTLTIGALSTNYWDGKIDEVGVFDKALSQSEIDDLYGSGSPPAYPFAVAGNAPMLGANF